VKNGKFEHKVEIPKSVKEGVIDITTPSIGDKDSNKISFNFKREILDEISDDIILTDILNTSNCKLNALLFANPDNTEEGTFYVEDTKSNINITFIECVDLEGYTLIKKAYEKGDPFIEKTKINGIDGYLDSSNGFVFKKDGTSYLISTVSGEDIISDDEKRDMEIILKAWLS
jgi:hypothetical protein